MGTYIHFTDEQKYRANKVDLADFLRQRGEKLLRSGPGHHCPRKQVYDHTTEEGSSAIDFVKNFHGVPFPNAMTMLLGGSCGTVYRKVHYADKTELEQNILTAFGNSKSYS